MMYWLPLVMALLLSACGVSREPSADISRMRFSSPKPESATLPGIPVTDEAMLKDALSEVLQISDDSLEMTISSNDGRFAAGSNKKAGEEVSRMWYAVKEKGGWQVVWQGTSLIPCDSAMDYPTSFIPECTDEQGKVIKR